MGNSDSPTQELAGLLGALAEGFESEQAEGVAGRSSGLDAATACDVLWSFAKLGHPAHSLCEAMARDLVDQARGYIGRVSREIMEGGRGKGQPRKGKRQ